MNNMCIQLALLFATIFQGPTESQPIRSACDELVPIWTAEAKWLPDDAQKLFEKLFCRWTQQLQLTVNPEDEDRFRKSISVLLNDYRKPLLDSQRAKREGCIAWIVWCTLRACDRPEMNDQEKQAILLEAEQLFKTVMEVARERLIPGPFPDMSKTLKDKLEAELSAAETNFKKHAKAMQDDYLNPAFKVRVPETGQKQIMKRLTAPGLYPGADERRPLLIRAEEAYEQKALDAIRTVAHQSLFWFLVEGAEVQWKLEKWNMFGTPGMFELEGSQWPALVRMRPTSQPSSQEVNQ